MKSGISIMVVDDEPLSSGRIKRLLKTDPDVLKVTVCESGKEALKRLKDDPVDLMFLDIQMPGMSGFEVLQNLDAKSAPYVIFVTGFDQYAIQAFEMNALDYLLKPFSKSRFLSSLQRAKDAILQNQSRLSVEELLHLAKASLQPASYWERIAVRMKDEVLVLKTGQIDWIEAQGRYVEVHAGKDSYIFREGIHAVEKNLNPTRFARIHRSYIVNLDRIQKLQPWFHGEYRVVLHDGTHLMLSRTYKPKLKQLFGE